MASGVHHGADVRRLSIRCRLAKGVRADWGPADSGAKRFVEWLDGTVPSQAECVFQHIERWLTEGDEPHLLNRRGS
jgi:hypothetical protein